jgi:dihydroorotate dehydrogenase
MLIYKATFRLLVLARIDAEAAHTLAVLALRAVFRIPGVRQLLDRSLAPRDSRLKVAALGVEFPSPVGLAAGVDSNASWFEALGRLGFGFVEVGTVTATAQAGNEAPRVFRLVADRAIFNRRGFPNEGAAVVADRLRSRNRSSIVGVNIGKTKETRLDDAGADYRASIGRLAPSADYVALNVSSPNTPGLRELQSVDQLRKLIEEARAEMEVVNASVPLLIKIAPDLTDAEIDAIADLAVQVQLDGIIAVNTTVDRTGLKDSRAIPEHFADGGVSGAPLKPRALHVLRRLRSRVGESLTLVSVGGIETPDDAWDRIAAGATLVQAHTGFVYGGPFWPRYMNRGLSKRLDRAKLDSIRELVGTGSATSSGGGESSLVESARSTGAGRRPVHVP